MTPCLAEIGDKLPTVPEMYLGTLLFGFPLIVLAVTHRHTALTMLVLSIGLAVFLIECARHQAFDEYGFSDAIWAELGHTWVVHSLVSSITPTLMILLMWLVHSRLHAHRCTRRVLQTATGMPNSAD